MLLLASSVFGLFKRRQFQPEVILLAVGWYLRFSLSYRDVEELLAERGLLGRPPYRFKSRLDSITRIPRDSEVPATLTARGETGSWYDSVAESLPHFDAGR